MPISYSLVFLKSNTVHVSGTSRAKLAYRRSIRFGPDTPDSRRTADLALITVARFPPANRLLGLKNFTQAATRAEYRISI
jgi:hypothetical protein